MHIGIGILQTLLDEGLVDDNTVFAMENDNWKRSNGKVDTAAEFVARALPLSDVRHYVSGTCAHPKVYTRTHMYTSSSWRVPSSFRRHALRIWYLRPT